MRLILSAYLRTLRERGGLDALLPDLLLEMGIRPLSKPQTGTRQYGVDLSAVGTDEDDVEKLFLFVLKQGDINRQVWDSSDPQSVRQSLNEIFDVYLKSHISTKYKNHPIKIVLCTSGDLKESVQANWSGYARSKNDTEFDFWGADEIALRIEEYMLNEHLFLADDRTDLRRTLALIGEVDYSLHDFHRLLLRQLQLDKDGQPIIPIPKARELGKTIARVNMATRLIVGWAVHNGDTRSAVKAAERALLWTWHLIMCATKKDQETVLPSFMNLFETYLSAAQAYIQKISPYCKIRDGFSGYSHDSVILGLTVFEHIGLLASIGLVVVYSDEKIQSATSVIDLDDILKALIGLIHNNPVSGSPPLDENSIDICLAFIFLTLLGQISESQAWLSELVGRVDYTYRVARNFPIGTDLLDDLVELHFAEPSVERRKELMETSWTLPILAGWSLIFKENEKYVRLAKGQEENGYAEVNRQLWHPTGNFYENLYFRTAQNWCGETEVPIFFETEAAEYRQKMEKLISIERYKVINCSPSYSANLFGLDFIAYRHFRTPAPPSFWYEFLGDAITH